MLDEIVIMRGQKQAINLIMFEMLDFDIILGIEIDYRKKKVQFSLNGSDEFTFGETQLLNMMINNVKARKMMSKGYIGSSAYCEYG